MTAPGHGDGFGEWHVNDDGIDIDIVDMNGVRTIELRPSGEPPCTCPCTLASYEGVLYGPATWSQVHEAVMQLPQTADFGFGLAEKERKEHPDDEQRPLSDLAVHFAPPGQQMRDLDSGRS